MLLILLIRTDIACGRLLVLVRKCTVRWPATSLKHAGFLQLSDLDELHSGELATAAGTMVLTLKCSSTSAEMSTNATAVSAVLRQPSRLFSRTHPNRFPHLYFGHCYESFIYFFVGLVVFILNLKM